MNYRLIPNGFGSRSRDSTVVATASEIHQTKNEISPLIRLKENQLSGSFVAPICSLP